MTRTQMTKHNKLNYCAFIVLSLTVFFVVFFNPIFHVLAQFSGVILTEIAEKKLLKLR
jgi:hypothetical protein